jgi:23S rRNA pseudouridine955/2504/2580 synthase
VAQPIINHSNLQNVRLFQVDESSEGQRLDNFLIRHLKGVPKSHIYQLIRSGQVRINKKRTQADARLEINDCVRVPPVRMAQGDVEKKILGREFPILFEDDYLLIIDKPSGVAVHGGSGVSSGVIEQLRQVRPQARFLELVHRIDRETSGILILAKKRSALTALQDQFRQHGKGGAEKSIRKSYAALVVGHWPKNVKVIDQALQKCLDAQGQRFVRAVSADHPEGLRSISLVNAVQHLSNYSLLDVHIKTGRTHQIRVHLSHQGYPIVGDPKYGDFLHNRDLSRGTYRFGRMFLHAQQIEFNHPIHGERMVITCQLPADCLNFLQALAG